MEEFTFKLPIDEDTKTFDFMALTVEQIAYLREHKTTALPPNMFKRMLSKVVRSSKEDGSQDSAIEGRVLEYVGFKLKNSFPHNVALMKDGSFVCCKRFTIPSGHINPIIEGHKFDWVREVVSIQLTFVFLISSANSNFFVIFQFNDFLIPA